MRKLLSGVVLCCGLLSSAAHAQDEDIRFYLGGGFSDGGVDVADGNNKSIGTLSANIGFRFRDYVGLELAVGSASDQASSLLSDPLVTYQAALLRVGYRWDRVGVYLLGGQALLDIDKDFNDSDSGVAVGFGINLFGNETTALNFNFLDFDDGAFTVTTIGLQYYFGGFR
ncbi:MAG: outer membrane beta-barrel protein [Granulosicoccus sp.]